MYYSIINTYTGETIKQFGASHSMSLDEAIKLVGEIYGENQDENVLIDDEWYYYDDLDLVVCAPEF